MNLLDEIEQMIGNEHLCNFSEFCSTLPSITNIKELTTNLLAQPHANKICDIADSNA